MSEQEQVSQLSALFDGELPAEQAGMVIRRALKDPAMRAAWGRYALIGACLRGDPLGGTQPESDIAGRVRARLAAEPEHNEVEAPTPAAAAVRRGSLLARGATGGAIAASVALVSLLVYRTIDSPVSVPAAPAVAEVTQAPVEQTLVADSGQRRVPVVAAAVHDSQPQSYTTPVDDSPARLVNYAALHSEVAATAVRFSSMSSMMNGLDAPMDAADIAALEAGGRR